MKNLLSAAALAIILAVTACTGYADPVSSTSATAANKACIGYAGVQVPNCEFESW